MISYVVAATFTEKAMAEKWLRWLTDGHVAEVIQGGATQAEVVALDGDQLAYEVRYRFSSREAFAAYERDHAPRLRAEGLAKFPVEQGVAYRRSLGTIVATY